MNQHIAEVIDLLDPKCNQIYNMSPDEARACLRSGFPEKVHQIDGSFALLDREGITVRMARSLDRPMRYFLAKREAGPALVVAERMDTIYQWLRGKGLGDQFHPSYTRMVPAHYVITIQLVGCPDPDPAYARFFNPKRNALAPDLDQIGEAYIRAAELEINKWLDRVPVTEPIGVCFSGGVDSGAIFLLVYHSLLKKGMSPARLKAFTLSFGDGPDLQQARSFLEQLGLGMFLEPMETDFDSIDVRETIRVVEDYKALDVQAASMVLSLCKTIRKRYPDWKYLVDGDGGDENLKDYPIEENPELTIRSVINNQMLYHEGWGVGKIKHSLTYSGGLSRSYTRTYAPARYLGFEGFSPFTRPSVIQVAEAIPFADLTGYDVPKLYALKGEVVARGIKKVTGMELPVFPKRRFQHGAVSVNRLKTRLPDTEAKYRREFLGLYV